jgi:uncharacterized protein
VKVTRTKLDEPVDAGEGFEVDEQISRITWTGDGKQGIVEPGQFQDFGLSVRIPDGKPGAKLTFKALQTYEGGEVVRWIGPEDADEPAPVVTLASAGATTPAAAQPAAPATAAADDGGPSDGLVIAALVLGALGLVAGLAGLASARRSRARVTA